MISKELLNPKSIGENIDKEIIKLHEKNYLVEGEKVKEEHIRSFVYSELKPNVLFIQAETNYLKKKKTECDLRIIKKDGTQIWVEIKTGWCGKESDGWANNPGEQHKSWEKDIVKLSALSKTSKKRCFILTMEIYSDPSPKKRKNVLDKINEIGKYINKTWNNSDSNIQANNEIKSENFTYTQDKLYAIKTFVWVER